MLFQDYLQQKWWRFGTKENLFVSVHLNLPLRVEPQEETNILVFLMKRQNIQASGNSSMWPSLRSVFNWMSYAVYSSGVNFLTVQQSLVSQRALLSAKCFQAWGFQGHDTTYFPDSSSGIAFFTSSSRSCSNTSSCAMPRWSKVQTFCSCSWTEAQNAWTWALVATPTNGIDPLPPWSTHPKIVCVPLRPFLSLIVIPWTMMS